MRQLRLLPVTVFAIALLAAPVQAVVRHGPHERARRSHATRHRHAHAHAQSHAPAVNGTGGVGRAVAGARLALSSPARAHAASDTAVTIADFSFTPASITIHVGDTVTWTNHGPSAHTATADNGSFNTGVLQKGQSASHTFNTAGTFSYICSIHPFMHGTVVVLANTTSTTPATTPTSTTPASTTPASTTPASTTPASTPSSGATAAQSSANTLPMTGFAVTGTVLAGVILTGLGLVLRKKIRA
jgi:LPXTG-motif cell wall-anchored protein